MADYLGTHYVQFRYNCLLKYWKVLERPISNKEILINDDDLANSVSIGQRYKGKTYSGEMTKGSIQRIQKAVNNLMFVAEKRKVRNPVTDKLVNHHLSFITLTFSQTNKLVSLKDGYSNFLKKFLDNGSKSWGMNYYVWKGEYQKNGQLHYHITTDAFIHYDKIKTYWNKLQREAGFIDLYRADQEEFHKYGFRLRDELIEDWPEDKQRAAYEKGVKENWQHPNSTDIHAVYKVRDIQSYLVKYLSKPATKKDPNKLTADEEELIVGGKVWGCSKSLQGLGYYESPMDYKCEESIRHMCKQGNWDRIDLENCQIVRWKTGNTKERADTFLTSEISNHLHKTKL